MFIENSFAITFIFFFLTSMVFTSFAFFIVSLVNTASSARLLGVFVFLVGFIAGEIIDAVFYSSPDSQYDGARVGLAFVPPFAFYAVVNELIASSSGRSAKGLAWEDIYTNILPESSDFDTFFTIADILTYMLLSFFVFQLLAVYIDKVKPDVNGYRLPFYYFLTKSYWFGSESTSKKDVLKALSKRKVKLNKQNMDEDVYEEALSVLKQEYEEGRDPSAELFGLQKTFGTFRAVDNIAYAIDNDQLFVLLGHNGAGKTTTFNMLTGLTIPSGGDAIVFGQSIKSSMDKIRPIMGVCPQHDVLWSGLSPKQHLRLFAVVKGLDDEQINEEIKARLDDVSLHAVQNNAVSTFSGGMKRRLSISLALIGNPKIVYLDEPTTGMDPVSRRDVWDMIARGEKRPCHCVNYAFNGRGGYIRGPYCCYE